MAAVTHGIGDTDTTNTTSYVTGSFTPAADDLLVVFVYAPGVASGISVTLSNSAGLTFYEAIHDDNNNYCFVAQALAANSSQTVTFDCTGDAATACLIEVARVSGMTATGVSAVRQTKTGSNSAGTTPAITFDAAPDSGNPVLAFVSNNSSTSPVVVHPSGWTELDEQVVVTPDGGCEYASIDSGAPTTVTWGGTITGGWQGIVIELQPTVPVGHPTIKRFGGVPFASMNRGVW